MKTQIVSLIILACSCLVAKADTITWTYFTGWDHGFALTVDDESSSISLHDQKTDIKQTKALHNSENILGYFEALIRRVKRDSVGIYADDGPENQVEISSGQETLKHTIYDVSPPHLFLHWKIQDPAFPVEDALKEADWFFEQRDAFLLLDQLRELKSSYFEEQERSAKSHPTAEQDSADQPTTALESKLEGKEKPKPESEERPK